MPNRLLIVEDDNSLNQMLTMHFEDKAYEVSSAANCQEASRLLESTREFDLILLDQQLPDGLGIEFIDQCLASEPRPSVIMMTGQHDLELAIKAIKKGATDFVHKPIESKTLDQAIEKALARRKASNKSSLTQSPTSRGLVGRSPAMLEVSKQIALSAESSATALITGESGTGKEIVARLIHQYSGREGPFIAINCAALVDNLLESELFGHVKGAFTGAVTDKPGKFELANKGTLFLDEIGELAPQLQAKLLRVLQERTYEPLGSTATRETSARLIAATHRDLSSMVEENAFREDLAYRLNVIHIHLPPLRERREDIPLLASALLDKAANAMGRQAPPLTDKALRALESADWPGNVRELENVLTRALVTSRNDAITPEALDFQVTLKHEEDTSGEDIIELISLDEMEARHIQNILKHAHGHKGRTCEILGISRPALDRKIKKYNLTLPSSA